MSATHALYRFYATDGALLYVGITADPGTRWRAHSHDKPWWHEVANVTIEQHPGTRCDRCWKWYDTLSVRHPDICPRCSDAVTAVKG